MASDPWHEAKQEVESTLATAHSLYDSFLRVRRTVPTDRHAASDELAWARDELNATLSALESDADELEESIHVVEQGGSRRFGIEDTELDRRKVFVQKIQAEINRMRAAETRSGNLAGKQPYRDDPDADLEEGDPNQDFERMQQSIIMEQQDRTLDSISGVIGTLREQAGVIGHEVLDQVGMLTNLEGDVDRSQSRLSQANKRMQQFIHENSKSKSSWCIFILTIVLVIILFLLVVT